MPVTNYHSVNGVLIGESTGGVRTDYLADALGSVTATMDQSANIKNTYRYKPYGDLLAKTGTDPDPKFMWNGSTGSRKTGLANSGQYNINRHYGTEQAAWTSRDPLWPGELAYVYVNGNAVNYIDPYGRSCGKWIRYGINLCDGSIWHGSVHECELTDPCQYALNNDPDAKGLRGFVACCRGKSIPCVAKGAADDAAVISCLKRHEAYHASLNPCRDDRRTTGCAGRYQLDENIEECTAYLAQVKCLQNEIDYLKCFPRRKHHPHHKRCSVLIGEMYNVCAAGSAYCKRAGNKDTARYNEICKNYPL